MIIHNNNGDCMLILCIKIFFARILDVTLGTIKTVYIIKEKKLIATIISFFEVLIWFEIARESLNTVFSSFLVPISYAGGYATGTYIGTFLSSKFIRGHLTMKIFSKKIKDKEKNIIKLHGYKLSEINTNNNEKLIIIEINKNKLIELKNIILELDPQAQIIINESKLINNSIIK